MASITHVTVTAPEGRRTPVGSEEGVEPGGDQLFVTSADICRVKYNHTTLRSVGRGDLILCNMDGEPVDTAEQATAPNHMSGSKIDRKGAKPKTGGKS